MLILGINAFHGDSSAALIRDGVLVAAAEEERFRRIKHWAGFPSQAIAYCLDESGATLADIERIALNQDSRANLGRKIGYVLRQRPDLGAVLQRLRNRSERMGVREHLASAFPDERVRAQVHAVEHHLAHLSSAFHVSPFENASILSVDGFGDFSSTAFARGEGSTISVDGRVHFPHSLGVFYQALTQYLGFPHYGDEYKVMGLAPYGKPAFTRELERLVKLLPEGGFELGLDYFRHHVGGVSYQWSEGAPEIGDLFSPALEQLLGPRRRPDEPLSDRHRDIARSVQTTYEKAFFAMLESLHARHGLDRLTLAGGCAMNSVANGKVRRLSPFRKVYVQSAAGDAGGAIGAAYAVWHGLGNARSFVMDHAYWGPQYGEETIASLIDERKVEIVSAGCVHEHIRDEERLCNLTADAIAAGGVVGWFQGRMEWGPRALGNRSILCDPRRGDMKAILNEKIKRRESFRPFAPSVLAEEVATWFEEEDEVPFMMQVFQIREERRAAIPAVTHVDGSGRLQTVSRATNPLYHMLISRFHAITGVPMVLNTSFNENEPVVCRPSEALDCFLRTRMDMLAIGSHVVRRN